MTFGKKDNQEDLTSNKPKPIIQSVKDRKFSVKVEWEETVKRDMKATLIVNASNMKAALSLVTDSFDNYIKDKEKLNSKNLIKEKEVTIKPDSGTVISITEVK